MDIVIYIAAKLIAIMLGAVSTGLLVRAILSFFTDDDSKLYAFFYALTEPFVVPVRFLLIKFNILQDSPIDWSFTITCLLIMTLQSFLPVI